jgi:hypothetical protein
MPPKVTNNRKSLKTPAEEKVEETKIDEATSRLYVFKLDSLSIWQSKDLNAVIPDIIIDLSKVDSYKKGIDSLRKILSNVKEIEIKTIDQYVKSKVTTKLEKIDVGHREINQLIPFKVCNSVCNSDSVEFYMRCSDLYIVGFRKKDTIKILEDESLQYPQYPENIKYVFNVINADKESLHVLGYAIAEATRSEHIEEYVLKLISQSSQTYTININDMLTIVDEKGNPITVYDLVHDWKHGKLLSEPKIKPSNKTSSVKEISAGGYKYDVKSGGFKLIDANGATKHPLQYAYSDHTPDDDDKGSGAISISSASEKDNVSSVMSNLLSYYLSWLNDLPQWLKEQMLNSTPIKILIESTKRDSAIFLPKLVSEDFHDKVLLVEQNAPQYNYTENASEENAQVDTGVDHSSMIDMSMILPVGIAAVSYFILPTAISSGPLSGKDIFFAGEACLKLLHGIEIF